MITLEQAIHVVRDTNRPLDPERVQLTQSLNRVLREDIISDIEMPPFDKSAVDGYACRKTDIKNTLEVIETVAAGVQPVRRIGKNQCAKIMTGAVLPEGADCVLLREHVDGDGSREIRFNRESTEVNICFKGEDVTVGQKLVSTATRIAPNHIAALALAGYSEVLVGTKPTVGIIATGDEIVEPSEQPGQSNIRNSNAYQLIAHCEQFGCVSKYYGIVKDSNHSILSAIEEARDENDVLLLTGGVSAGDLDLVPTLLEKAQFETVFRGVGIQPGRPTIFGKLKQKYVFGIPGSPVASFVVFEVLVKELLASLMGLASFVRKSRCPLASSVTRQKTNRIGWRPVSIADDGKAHPIEYHGTAHISSYAKADGLIAIPIGTSELHEGDMIEVRLF